MNYTFKWSVLWSGQSGGWLLQGLITTLELSALAWLLAVALGILSGALRTVPFRPLRWGATFYVEFFRNVPLLVWMFFWYFGVTPLLPRGAQDWLFNHGLEFWAGTIALGRVPRRADVGGHPLGHRRHPPHAVRGLAGHGTHDLPGLPPGDPARGPPPGGAARPPTTR